MRIRELTDRTGTTRRLLRYYEEQQLLTPGRSGYGYREYDEGHVDRVVQIRGLLDAGPGCPPGSSGRSSTASTSRGPSTSPT